MKRDRDGTLGAVQQPPRARPGAPPRVPPGAPAREPSSSGSTAANGTAPPAAASSRLGLATAAQVSTTNGVPGGGGGGVSTEMKHAPSTLPVASTASLSTASLPTALKRSKFGLDPPMGWRAAADDILLRAGGASVGGGVGVSTQAARGVGKARVGALAATSRRKFAAVCSANFNRSMMAHKLLQENRFHVKSFGTGRDVRLPGKDAGTPEVFAFGTPYRDMFDVLTERDEDFFRRNNLLGLVARNASIKASPQRFQEIEGPEVAGFDVVLCFDSRVFYLVVEDLQSRDPETFKPLHVVNMTIKDSPEESAAAAGDVLDLCRMLDEVSQLEEKAAGALEAFTKKTGRTILHQVCHV